MNLHELFDIQDPAKFKIISIDGKLNTLCLSSKTFWEVPHCQLPIGTFLQRKGEKPETLYLLARVGDPSKTQRLTAAPVFGDLMRSTPIVDVVNASSLSKEEAIKIFGSDLAGWEIIGAKVLKVI